MIHLPTSYGELRLWAATDAPALVKYANDRQIWLNLRDAFPHPYTLAQAEAFLALVQAQRPGTLLALATPTEAIGSIGLAINSDVHRLTAELGYWLAQPFWGRGIMSETIRIFVDYAFEHFDLVRIYAEPYAPNLASCRVLEKAGFEREGYMRANVIKDGQILDQWLYARVKPG